jgi:drug/metabolite transporter (DMT)-like permease
VLRNWRSSPRLALICLLVVTAIWGSTFVVVKDAVSRVPVMDFLAIRFVLAAALMVLLRPASLRGISRNGMWKGVALGCCLGAGYIAQTIGLRYASAAVSGFITGMFVVFAPLISWLVLRKMIGARRWFAVGIALVGLALIGMRGWTIGTGELLTLACALFFAFHIVGLGEWSSGQEPYGLALVQIGTVGLATTAIALSGGMRIPLDPGFWIAIVITSVFATALAFVVQTWAQSILHPAQAAVVLTMEPVFAGLIAVLLARERLSVATILGAACIVAAMLIAQVRASESRASTRRPNRAAPAQS